MQEESGKNLIGKTVWSAGEKFKQVEIFLLLFLACSAVVRKKKKKTSFFICNSQSANNSRVVSFLVIAFFSFEHLID